MAYIVKIDDREFRVRIERKDGDFIILLDDKEIHTEVLSAEGNSRLALVVDREPFTIFFDEDNHVFVNGESYAAEVIDEQKQKLLKGSSNTFVEKELTIKAPMPGLVLEVMAAEGDTITSGQSLFVVEAMKMQNEIKTPRDGLVKRVFVKKGQTVNSADSLITIE